MRLFWNISLILLLLSPTLVKLGVFSNYIINQNYYATELCKFKNVEDNSCLGSCVFSSEIAQLEDSTSDEDKRIQNLELSLYTFNGNTKLELIRAIVNSKNDFIYFERYSDIHLDLDIKPPIV
jgi:hypothetical protein